MLNCVTRWLDETAGRFPDKTAFSDINHSYTFSEVRKMAVSIAHNIHMELGRTKQPVAVYMDKSSDMLIAYLGIAYSGNFYSPIATDMPSGRIEKILETLNPGLLICEKKYENRCGSGREVSFSGKKLVYQELVNDEVEAKEIEYLEDRIIDTDLLYVLFTSGSTGNPKGVAITHRGVLDYIDWVTDTFSIDKDDSFGNQAPFYFDNSILDIYSSVKTGATLYIIPDELFSQPVKLLAYLLEKKITTVFWVPSALIMVSKLKAFRNVDVSAVLKRVLFAGEVMPNKQLNIWRKYLPDLLYANLYGPTEITDACTYYIVDREFSDEEPLPIGIPMRNTDILVLKEDNTEVVGTESGELCVRGTGVAVGYYNNPEKTKEAFVQNPLNTVYPERIYRTGDIVHYNGKGELIYVCRKDFQIKHMGYRIELGEIETAVSSLEAVDSCCCLYDDNRKKIVLFLDKELDKPYINTRISKIVPEYMLPNKVISLEQLPLNANGKIDRVKLKELL
ncbi:MAG: amino acid adenylation domain-containing protein [Lachnospiraceae bacterium]|nr:amino acid adenylation domain-containing protein [Lachnospiraceae bacterium]